MRPAGPTRLIQFSPRSPALRPAVESSGLLFCRGFGLSLMFFPYVGGESPADGFTGFGLKNLPTGGTDFFAVALNEIGSSNPGHLSYVDFQLFWFASLILPERNATSMSWSEHNARGKRPDSLGQSKKPCVQWAFCFVFLARRTCLYPLPVS